MLRKHLETERPDPATIIAHVTDKLYREAVEFPEVYHVPNAFQVHLNPEVLRYYAERRLLLPISKSIKKKLNQSVQRSASPLALLRRLWGWIASFVRSHLFGERTTALLGTGFNKPVEKADGWFVEFFENEDLDAGDVVIEALFQEIHGADLDATIDQDDDTVLTEDDTYLQPSHERSLSPTSLGEKTVYALLVYSDDEGEHRIEMTKAKIVIGRIGDAAFPPDVPVHIERYVSKFHAYIKFEDGQFSICDVSKGGTFVNKTRLPSSRDKPVREQKWTALPDEAVIGLGNPPAITMTFRAGGTPAHNTGTLIQDTSAPANGTGKVV